MRRLEMPSPSPSAIDQQRVAHGLEIVQRLAHAHHHDVADEARSVPPSLTARYGGKIAEPVARHHHLADDLAGR